MTWQFRFRNHPLSSSIDPDNCSHIRPLLSLMSDGMASAKEIRQAEAHLQTCDDCRQAQMWIDATRQVIAARPVVLPPADMRARIARAIAASAETAVPAVPLALPPVRRTFALRPAYAAAASVAVASAFLGHYLLTAGNIKPVLPVRSASSGQGRTNAIPSAKPGRAGNAPLSVSRKQSLVVATVPPGGSEQQNSATSARARQSNPSSLSIPGTIAPLFTHPASPRSVIKPNAMQVASGAHRPATPAPAAAKRHSDMIAVRPAPKAAAGVRTHTPSDRPLMATLPALPAETRASTIPSPVTGTPMPAPAPNSATVVARLPDTSPAPPRAASGDALVSIRPSLASYRSEGYARRLSMASGVHLHQSFVPLPIAYTPTSLSEAPTARRTAAAASHPATMQAIPQTASLTPVSAVNSSNQRRSERDKQWSDAPTNGGA
jgi:hypothetical protein